MLLTYTAKVVEERNRYTASIYMLPVKYSFKNKALSDEEAIREVLDGVARELEAYLRAAIKKKMPFPLPFYQPVIYGDYDIPVPLDLAFIMILRIFRSNASQKDLAEQLGKSAAYLSSIESLETGVTLANAHEMLSRLGIKTSLFMNPYKPYESYHYQYSTNDNPPYNRIPVIKVAGAPDWDLSYNAQYAYPQDKQVSLPFPAKIEPCQALHEGAYKVTIPALESYNLDVTIVDRSEYTVTRRASTVLNLLLLSCEKKIKYPSYKRGKDILELELWSETAKKLFPKEKDEFFMEWIKSIPTPPKPEEE